MHPGLWELTIQIMGCPVSSGEDPRILELRKSQIIQTPPPGGAGPEFWDLILGFRESGSSIWDSNPVIWGLKTQHQVQKSLWD